MACMGDDSCHRLEPALAAYRRYDYRGGGASEIFDEEAAVSTPPCDDAQRRIWPDRSCPVFVGLDDDIALAALTVDRDDFVFERARRTRA
jgi:hypothetical protein